MWTVRLLFPKWPRLHAYQRRQEEEDSPVLVRRAVIIITRSIRLITTNKQKKSERLIYISRHTRTPTVARTWNRVESRRRETSDRKRKKKIIAALEIRLGQLRHLLLQIAIERMTHNHKTQRHWKHALHSQNTGRESEEPPAIDRMGWVGTSVRGELMNSTNANGSQSNCIIKSKPTSASALLFLFLPLYK